MAINHGVDTGYGYVMGSCEAGEVKFSSYISEISEKQALEIKENISKPTADKLLVKYKDEYFVLGKLCEENFINIGRQITNDRVGDKFHLVQMLSALALNSKAMNNVEINLMVGLPNRLTHFRKAMKDWLEGKKFEISLLANRSVNKTITINICHCLLQPVFPIFSAFGSDDIEKNKIMSIDIGHSSTDAVVMNNYSYSQEKEDTVSILGMSRVYSWIEEALVDRYHKGYKLTSVSENVIQKFIETGVFHLNGKVVDVEDILDKAMTKYAKFLFNEVEKKYIASLPLIDIVLVSGGVANNEYFMKTFAGLFKDIKIDVVTEEDPQWSVVRGMKIVLDEIVTDDAIEKEKVAK